VTALLEQAIAEVAKLSPEDQDAIAVWLLEEMQSERCWQRSFDQSPDLLAALADEALAEYRSGQTQSLDSRR
jgi:predicted amidophosphoribosyltransferase